MKRSVRFAFTGLAILAMLPFNLDKDLSQPDAPHDEYIYWTN